MSCVAIIPARGGSKGIPAKNLQPIGGVPLIGWAVRAAVAAESVDAVYVSTDSTAIAKVALEYGATVIMRPAELAGDEVPTLPVVQHAVEQLADTPDAVVVMQCTSPLTAAEDVDWAVERLTNQYDAVVSVVEDHGFILSGAGSLLNYTVDERRRRRQDREPRYRVNGALFVLRTPLRDQWPSKLGLYVMPQERSIDIDSPVDLHLAESLLRYEQAWIVCGSGPDAREMLAVARARYPGAMAITTNAGINLFVTPDRPDVYFLTDARGCQIYHEQAKAIQKQGSRLVTLRRDIQALKQRRVDHFDQFVPITGGPSQFVRGGYTACLSGLLCVQYAINNGARQIHLVGMNGYTGTNGGDYFGQYEPPNRGRKRRMHTESVIGPFMQAAVESCTDIEFVAYGQLNYPMAGPNVRHVVPRGEMCQCE